MIPTNEQGVVALFSKLSHEMGYEFKRIGTHCPDAILEKDGREVRVEFEYRASSFRAHKHDPAAVDLIICWEDDWPESPVPVLSLQMYLTLTQHEAPKEPAWRRFILWRQTLLMAWVDSRRAVQEHRARNQVCPKCGEKLTARCTYGHQIEDGANIYNKGVALAICPKCNYTKSQPIEYQGE